MVSRTVLWNLSVGVVVCWLACSGDGVAPPGFTGTGSGGQGGGRMVVDPGDAGVVGAGGRTSDGGAFVRCPELGPGPNSPCPKQGLLCDIGWDPRPDCQARAECGKTGWSPMYPICTEPPRGDCPAVFETARDSVCYSTGAFCSYGAGLYCECTACPTPSEQRLCGGETRWRCTPPNPDPECSPGRPGLGSACSIEGKVCSYRCGPEGGRVCRDGVWVRRDGGICP